VNKKLRPLPIGIDSFSDLRNGGYYYADKSLFIQELIDAGQSKVTLIPRPRRFGKTLNMTMLKCFFENEREESLSQKALFEGLAISQYDYCMKHQKQYPVIFLTFKEIKSSNWISCYDKLQQSIAAEFERHNYILQSDVLTLQQKKDFSCIVGRTASQAVFENSLKDLSLYLQKYYNSKVVILIDEYDSPIHAGFLSNYYDEIISFMRGLLCGGLKGNTNLSFGVLTGILRVARESIFSGMNNLDVHTLLSPAYADKFGLIESEIVALLQERKITYDLDKVRSWYNGYAVGGIPIGEGSTSPYTAKIYNPWSILKFAQSNGSFGEYWANTSDNKLIEELVQRSAEEVKIDFERILTGKSVKKTISEDIIFSSLEKNADALWSFLVFCGYLTWKSREPMQIKCEAELIAPNHEVIDCFNTLINRWFTDSKGDSDYKNLLISLKSGNISLFKERFIQSILEHFSCFDTGGKTPERVYHAYVLGMLVALSKTHVIKSNGEAGHGRYDVCIIPHDKNQVGTIIEFKAFNLEDDKTMKLAASAALAQIEEKQYEVELRKHGVTKIVKYGIVFKGKKVLISHAST